MTECDQIHFVGKLCPKNCSLIQFVVWFIRILEPRSGRLSNIFLQFFFQLRFQSGLQFPLNFELHHQFFFVVSSSVSILVSSSVSFESSVSSAFFPVEEPIKTRRRLARERKRWCYSSRKYDDHKITDEIFQCNLKMRKTERKKSERETYSEREREKRSADM